MSTDHDRTPFEPLDAEPGPALPLSHAEALAQADAVLARMRPKRPLRARLVLVAAAVLLLSTGAFAAVAVMVLQQRAHEDAARSRQAREAAPRVMQLPAPEASSEPNVARGTAPARPARQPSSAHDWVELANSARAQRDFVRALRLYQRAAELHPGSDDAYAANLASAELQAQHLGRPREAVALYRKLIAARPAGALAEQARVGLARAYGALAEPEAEKAAWRELLAKHPDSWFAEEARARLER